MFAVLTEDVLMRCTAVRHARVVVTAKDVRSSLEGMVADAPTTLGVAVHLAHTGVDANAHGADERYLTDVGPDTRPKVVVGVGSALEDTRVKGEPVTDAG